VVVHADETWDHGSTGQIENLRAVGRLRGRGIADRYDFSVVDHYRLIGASRGAGAVYHANVIQHDGRSVFANERFYPGAKATRSLSNGEGGQQSTTQK
jgi:hypothetical protein